MNAAIALLALVIEQVFGYPDRVVERVGHPVQWIGKAIDAFEARTNLPERTDQARRAAGATMIVVLCVSTLVVTLALSAVLRTLPFGWLIEAVLASSLLAGGNLAVAVRKVANALELSVGRGREAVSDIVGRDTDALDEAEVARAAVESLAENASDGFVAPLFWLLLFGLPGGAVYKVINTADSMVGHRNERFLHFGWASARLDDIANFIPARLTALLFVAAATLMREARAEGAWAAARRDAKKHASPNAGWPEAAMGGALGFALGGPRSYHGEVVDLPHMGDGKRDLGPDDIRLALELYTRAIWLTAAVPVFWILLIGV